MVFYYIKNLEDLHNCIKKEVNLDDTRNNIPEEYPCVAVVAYLGEGWDEIAFVYKSAFITNGDTKGYTVGYCKGAGSEQTGNILRGSKKMTQNEAILDCITHWEENVKILKEHTGKKYIFRDKYILMFESHISMSFSFVDCSFCTFNIEHKTGLEHCNYCPGVIANGFRCVDGGPWSRLWDTMLTNPSAINEKHIAAAQEVLDWVAKAKKLLTVDYCKWPGNI
jgi:hypothetical protein